MSEALQRRDADVLPAAALAFAFVASAVSAIASWVIAKFTSSSTGAVARRLLPTIHLVVAIAVSVIMLGGSGSWAMLYTIAYIFGAIPGVVIVVVNARGQRRSEGAGLPLG